MELTENHIEELVYVSFEAALAPESNTVATKNLSMEKTRHVSFSYATTNETYRTCELSGQVFGHIRIGSMEER